MDLIRQEFDAEDVNITIPTLNLTDQLPDPTVLDDLDDVNITASDPDSPLADLSVRDLVDGDLTLTLDELLVLLEDGEAGLIEIPIGDALDFG